MENIYDFLKFWHVLSFVFMSVPLFNLIIVNERALLGVPFNYYADRYMENIIGHGAVRCYIFQFSVFLSGILLLVMGPSGITALWTNIILLLKMILLLTLTGLLSYVHFFLQPRIESIMSTVSPDSEISDKFLQQIKAPRLVRKKMATFCLFLVITVIILGLQTYSRFSLFLTLLLIIAAALFSWHVNKTLIRLGWI